MHILRNESRKLNKAKVSTTIFVFSRKYSEQWWITNKLFS